MEANDVITRALIALNLPLAGTPGVDSVHDYLERIGGELVSKAATMNVNNGTQSVALFTLTGSVLVYKIWGVLTAKTTLTNCTNLSLDLYDATAAVQITKSTGTTLSGLAVGTMLVKNGLAAVNLGLHDNATGVVGEPAASGKDFSEFAVTKKNGATTQIRMTYTSTDAPANAVLTWYLAYRKLSADGALVAA